MIGIAVDVFLFTLLRWSVCYIWKLLYFFNSGKFFVIISSNIAFEDSHSFYFLSLKFQLGFFGPFHCILHGSKTFCIFDLLSMISITPSFSLPVFLQLAVVSCLSRNSIWFLQACRSLVFLLCIFSYSLMVYIFSFMH